MRTTTAQVVPLGGVKPFEWTNIYQVTNILRSEINAAVMRKVKYKTIAEKCGIRCPQTISKIGAGETKEPRATTCLLLLHYFGYRVVVYPPAH